MSSKDNQSLQLTLDSASRSATAEHPTASSAAELRRYAADRRDLTLVSVGGAQAVWAHEGETTVAAIKDGRLGTNTDSR